MFHCLFFVAVSSGLFEKKYAIHHDHANKSSCLIY
jgi:hypothetical protein